LFSVGGQLSKICQDLGPLFPLEIVTSVKNEAEFLGSLSKNHNFYWMSKLAVAEKIDLLIHLSRYFLWFFYVLSPKLGAGHIMVQQNIQLML